MNKSQHKNHLYYLLPFYKLNGYFKGSIKKNKLKYIKSSLIAMLIGFIISSVFIIFSESNPFTYFYWTFKIATNKLFISSTILTISLYIFAAVSLSIGFKCKVFNIGIAGQMMLAGALVLILGIKCPHLSKPSIIILGLIISVITGSLLSLFSALLKTFFNVHEVVTTIMMNWIIFYFLKWLFISKGPKIGIWDSTNSISTLITNPNFNASIAGNEWILPFTLAIIILIIMGIVFYKTRFGFQTLLLGENTNTAKYIGTNSNKIFIIIMLFQGAIAGILGMFYYMDYSQSQLSFVTGTYPLFGFNAFSVSLISFNNPIAIFFISILWGLLDTGAAPASQLPQFHISKEVAPLIYGVIIYFSAIYIIFINFNLTLYIKKLYYNRKFYKEDYNKYRIKLKQNKKNYVNFKRSEKNKVKIAISNLSKHNTKTELWIQINQIKKNSNNEVKLKLQEIIQLKKQYKIKYNDNYIDHNSKGKLKIKNDFKINIQSLLFELLNKSVEYEYEYKIKIMEDENNKKNKSKHKKELMINISHIISEYKKNIFQLKNDKNNNIKNNILEEK